MGNHKQILSGNSEELITFYNAKVKGKLLENDNYLAFAQGIIEIICYSSPDKNNSENIKKNVVEIYKPWVLLLNEVQTKLTEDTTKNITVEETNTLVGVLEVLKYISKGCYEGLDKTNRFIFSEIFVEIWPKIRFLLDRFSTNSDIIENLMQLIKYFMRGMDNNFQPYLEEYCRCLIKGYEITPISSYIYGFEILMTVFSDNQAARPAIDTIFSMFCELTLSKYLKSKEDLNTNVQLGEDFFGLLGRIMKLNPFVVLDSNQAETIIKTCVENLDINHIETSKAITLFLIRLFNYRKLKSFSDLQQQQPELYEKYKMKADTLIKGISDEVTREILNTIYSAPVNPIFEQLKELVGFFINYSPENAYNYFAKNLVGCPSDCLTNKEKENFVNCIRNNDEDEMDNLLEKLVTRSRNKKRRERKAF